jgi:hypothetical protein
VYIWARTDSNDSDRDDGDGDDCDGVGVGDSDHSTRSTYTSWLTTSMLASRLLQT